MREVFLLGVGTTAFGPPGRAAELLAREAARAALADAGVGPLEIAAMAVGTGLGQHSQLLASFWDDAVPVRLEPPTASAAQALQLGWQAVAGGAHDIVLCLGTECRAPHPGPGACLAEHAHAAQRYMTASGATIEHFARVAAKNRRQGADNPRALNTMRVDTSAVLASEMLVWPLRRLMVATRAEGASAVVLASSDARRRIGARAPRVRASVLVQRGGAEHEAAAARAGRLAYQAASVGPEDIDCAELDELTAAGEVAAYEALQFAPEGQGPELVDSGFTALGGVLPVNTSGGALAQGEATGASGIAQLCELAWQLRGEAGRRQVAGARVGLALSTAPLDGNGGPALLSLTILSAG